MVSTPPGASTPSTRASDLGVAAWPGRRRPGCAAGRAENRRMAHHPSSEPVEESCFPSWYGNCPSARIGTHPFSSYVWRGGFHKEGEGPSFGDSFVSFSSLRKRPQRSASPLPDWQFCARFTIKSETIQNFCIVSFFIYLAAHRSSRYAPQSATRENTLPGLRRSRASVTPSCQAADRQVTPTWSQESTSVAVSPI